MKILLTILPLFLCLHLVAQEAGLLIVPMVKPVAPRWYSISSNDAAIMALQLSAGYAQGWRDELLYHPHQLLNRFGLQDKPFWNDEQPVGPMNMQWDADHLLKAYVIASITVCIVIKIGDLKSYGKHWWKKAGFDFVKYYGAYKLGFFLAYNVTHGNKL